MSGVLELSPERQLFIDDYAVKESHNLRQVLNQPTKYAGNPLIRPHKPWEGPAVNLYGTVVHDPEQDTFRMWYQGYGGTPYTACYATSRDGIYWQKPNLELVEFGGSTENNMFLDDACILNVIQDDQEQDPERLYKALFWEQHNPSVSVAFSPDGVQWRKYEGNPVLQGTSDTHTLLGWDEACGKYVAYIRPGVRDGTHIRVIGRSVSDDFVHWTEPQVVLQPDEHDPPAFEFYGMPVFKYQGLYLGLPWAYYAYPEEPLIRMAALMDVQLAVSRDGVHWQRAGDRQPFIPRGPAGSIDQGMIYTAKEPVIVGDELWFYYGGYDGDHGTRRNANICLAKLRLDGFISMDAGDQEGTLVTKPFYCAGKDLLINADARGGCIAVAVLDQAGNQASDWAGYKKIDCALFDGDAVRHKVTWRDNVSLEALRGQPIRLKFYLQQAKLYSFAVA